MTSAATPPGLADVTTRIRVAAHAAGREASSVHLVAVSKTFQASAILPVLAAGHRLFGENRVQEAAAKWPALRERFPDLELHLIGPLQSNKVRDAVRLFDAIHSIDRPKIAGAVAEEMAKQGKRLKLFLQVNTGDEPQKAGISVQRACNLHEMCQQLQLTVAGLMCIPPFDEPPAPHFALLAKLAGELGLSELSMGMSADFETAIGYGAAYVRVGSAIFGSRPPPQA